MSRGIFVSSSSGDAPIVRRMIGRLRDLGLNPPPGVDLPRLWHYEEDVKVGDAIFRSVSDAIAASAIAVLCVSDEALKRPWIAGEVALLRDALARNQLDHLIRVKVGPLTDASLASVRDFVRSPDDLEGDVSAGAEAELEKVAAAIHAKLGLNAPKQLAIAVLAMTDQQSAGLVKDWTALHASKQSTPVSRVCETVGLTPEKLFTVIGSRYGASPEEMKPFRGETLRDIIHAELNQANLRRVMHEYVPLFPRWVHGELLGTDAGAAAEARGIWGKHDSLLIIDAISVFHPDVIKQLARLPDFRDPLRGAVVCLPPYTRQTVILEEALREAFGKNPDLARVAEWFETWVDRWANPDRVLAFDTPTSVSLGSWLDRRFTIVGGKHVPQSQARQSMPTPSYTAGVPKQ